MYVPKYFKPSEFADFSKMDPEFLEWLENLREEFGRSIRINSSYRDPNHNESVGGVSKSAHTEIPCRAVDIHCPDSKYRYALVLLAGALGCRRIGVGETFVHLDFSTEKTQDVLWTYYK